MSLSGVALGYGTPCHVLGVGEFRARCAIVVDSFDDIDSLASLTSGHRLAGQRVLIRVTPGIDAGTHPAGTSGREEQRFGFSISSGAAVQAVRRVLAIPELQLVGVHCDIGSQISATATCARAVTRVVAFLNAISLEFGLRLPELSLGGGHAIACRPGNLSLAAAEVAVVLRTSVVDACAAYRLPLPRLTVEFDRGIAGPPGTQRLPAIARTGANRGGQAVLADHPTRDH